MLCYIMDMGMDGKGMDGNRMGMDGDGWEWKGYGNGI